MEKSKTNYSCERKPNGDEGIWEHVMYLIEKIGNLLGLHQLLGLHVLRLILCLLLRQPLNICLDVMQTHIHFCDYLLQMEQMRGMANG